MKKSIILLFAVSVSLFSCKKVVEELEAIGKFTSTISGDVSKQFDGNAAFVHTITVQGTPKGSSLVIGLSLLTDQSETIGLSLLDNSISGISAGTYELNSSGIGTTFVPVYTNGQVVYALPDATKTNKITINSVKDLRVEGTFEVNLIEASTQKAIKIAGAFDAVGTTESK